MCTDNQADKTSLAKYWLYANAFNKEIVSTV